MKTALITGASSGIGRATAVQLAGRGHFVIAAGRSEERMEPVLDEITQNGGSAEYLHLDLASLSSCEIAGRAVEESGRSLDVLVNNAGVGGVSGITEDGFEAHFGVNHLGHFALTHHLRRAFRPGTRIVVVSSEAHRHARSIDWHRATAKTRPLRRFHDYAVSKLANILFVRRLAQLQPDWNAYAVHPGLVETPIYPTIAKPFFRNRKSPDQGAETSVWCSTAAELSDESGLYYSDSAHREPSTTALNDELGHALWDRSESWCGVEPLDR